MKLQITQMTQIFYNRTEMVAFVQVIMYNI